ncbi:MAG: hypothetical protein ACPG32_01115 [Akkermansiaceae bacterium]
MMLKILPLVMLSVFALSSCDQSSAEPKETNPNPPAETDRNMRVIHVFVALCDNESQGIAPVPAKIGNGDDPANNLYWGCSDGARAYFSKSKLWKRLSVGKAEGQPEILERLVFQHKKTRAILVIDAWRGSEIQPCIDLFCRSTAGQHYESFTVGKKKINIAGGADFLTFIGHNGLMEFRVPALAANPNRKQPVDAAVLCCRSDDFFTDHLSKAGADPAILTASNMYPGAFILHDVLEGWFKKENTDALRLRAAKAYAKNQKISTKSALNVFAKIKRP